MVGSGTAEDGKTEIAVDASMGGEPGFLFDAVVLPQGDAAIDILMDDPNVLDFVKNIYRHGKTIVAFSGQHRLLELAGVSPSLPDASADPGIVIVPNDPKKAFGKIEQAIARHTHPERELARLS